MSEPSPVRQADINRLLGNVEDTELEEVQNVPYMVGETVQVIPPNRPVKREDLDDLVYRTIDAKFEAVVKDVEERHDPFQGYQRTCRNIDPAEAQRRIDDGEPYTIRIKVPLDRGDVIVHDAVHGDVTFNARELDDFIIFRSDGTPTYNFATVVDDAGMGITHIILLPHPPE